MRHAGTQLIRSERLSLRRIEPDDAVMMFNNWANDDEVTRYMRWSAHKNLEETKATIQNWFEDYKDNNKYHWGICLENGEMIGTVAVIITSEYDFKAEIGYCIGRKWWSHGYTSEAVKAVVDYMFVNTDIERIEAYHSVENPASGRVMAKAGMLNEGFAQSKYRNRDGFQDCDLYGITRNEWETQKDIAYYNTLPVVFDGFIELPELTDGVIHLVCMAKNPAVPEKKYVPSYAFAVCKGSEKLGTRFVRVARLPEWHDLYKAGQRLVNIYEWSV